MSKTVILTGYAVVSFRKVLTDMSEDEVNDLRESKDLQEEKIEEGDLNGEVGGIYSIEIEVQE